MSAGTEASATAASILAGASELATSSRSLSYCASKLPLHAPLGAIAEEVEGGAAQALQRRQQAKTLHHPGPKLDFLGVPSLPRGP